jgi:hypothetical protein
VPLPDYHRNSRPGLGGSAVGVVADLGHAASWSASTAQGIFGELGSTPVRTRGRAGGALPARETVLLQGCGRSGPEDLLRERWKHCGEHLKWFTAEWFGGPGRFTREPGFWKHDRRAPPPEDRRRAPGPIRDLFVEAFDEAALPGDQPFRRCGPSQGRIWSQSRTAGPRPMPNSDHLLGMASPRGLS